MKLSLTNTSATAPFVGRNLFLAVSWQPCSLLNLSPCSTQRAKRELKEQQERELLEKRKQFKEATKDKLLFAPEEPASKEKPAKGRKVR